MIQQAFNAVIRKQFVKIAADCRQVAVIDVSEVWLELTNMVIPSDINPQFGFHLEEEINCLPKKYLIGYLLACLFNVFNEPKNIYLLYDERSKLDPETLFVLDQFVSSMNLNADKVYYYRLKLQNGRVLDIPWHPYILSNINYVYKKTPRQKILDRLDKDIIQDKVLKLIRGDYHYYSYIFDPRRAHQHFAVETSNTAVCVNGTACVGKSSVLNSILAKIRTHIDENSFIIKSGKLGGFKGKDVNQILSLEYQCCGMSEIFQSPTALMDRCPFNNLIWRYILRFVEATELDDVALSEHIANYVVDTLSHNMVRVMRQYPVVVLIDTNVVQNRKRMYYRATGGDSFRCFIEKYAPMQNLFYALFADLAKWPVYNTAIVDENYPMDQHERIRDMKTLILEKIKQNALRRGKIQLPLKLAYNVSFGSDIAESFEGAIRTNIMK
ncbi:p-loop NTPase [Penaeus vannamei nudivirus]|nr:p-loop NTPase [Penaeus vannamei nucleopolyhedrovirus]